MMYVGLFFACLSIAIACWLIQYLVGYAWNRYRSAVEAHAQTSLSELFVFIDTTHLWPALCSLAVMVGLSVWLLSRSVLVTIIMAALILVCPRVLLAAALRRRLCLFDSQWPDALTAIAGALRSGVSIGMALKHFAEDAPAPMSQELSLVMREHRMGLPLHQALDELKRRMPTESVELVTALLAVGNASGGSMAGLLERLSNNLRARQHVTGKINMLTAQGKMQAWVMGALPLVLLIALSQIDPASVELMFFSQTGQLLLGVVFLLECLGIFWLRRILAIEV
jgi:tight adherence protein B